MSSTKNETTWKVQVANKFFNKFAVSFDEKFIDLIVEPNMNGLFAPFLWAESKKGVSDISRMFAQLLLTIKPVYDKGKKNLPKYLGVFDKEKIVFVEFYHIMPIFLLNDFNWNEKPSAVSKKTENIVAKFLYPKQKKQDGSIVVYEFYFADDEDSLKKFIKTNFTFNGDTVRLQITKNNFLHVYNRWVAEVRPSIAVTFDTLKESDLIDGDFYLADLLSEDNESVRKTLKVSLQKTVFCVNIKRSDRFFNEVIQFHDKGWAHDKFWTKYERPPAKEYWDYMIDRRDLLVPQKIREQKGAYFTPKIWVEKSQEYLEKAFGENWQDEYYIWDCCCGTGNLLAGLANPDNVWASTIDQPDVEVLNELIDSGYNLLKPHVFQFDFLNDKFISQSNGGKIPDSLFNIINDPDKQKKLIIYINPPYAETGDGLGTQTNKDFGFAQYQTHTQYKELLGKASHEFFSQFFIHIFKMMPLSNLAAFSKMKYVNSFNFERFRQSFQAKFKSGFICRSDTFDNVQGKFPIGFLIWNLSQTKFPKQISVDILNEDGEKISKKRFCNGRKYINEWMNFFPVSGKPLGILYAKGMDFQNNQGLWISLETKKSGGSQFVLSETNLMEGCIYFAVRHCIEHTWLNDRDQFLFPDDSYKKNKHFQNNCLTFTLFHHQNRISTKDGVNHWIPFARKEVEGKDTFKSTFMYDFLQTRGKFSKEANVVFDAGKMLWTYYHETIKSDDNADVNASLYDIREYFKGRKNGRMNTKATDQKFNELDQTLRNSLKNLAEVIKPKVYEYGFLPE